MHIYLYLLDFTFETLTVVVSKHLIAFKKALIREKKNKIKFGKYFLQGLSKFATI